MEQKEKVKQAIALSYDPEDDAPRVIASGKGALAERIIDYREAHGPFETLEDLLEVKGIGEATLEKFRDHATVS